MSADLKLIFLDGSFAATAGTAYFPASTGIKMGKDGGALDRARFYAQITADVAGTSSTVQFILQRDTTSAFSSAATVYDSTAIAEATLVPDYVVKVSLLSDLSWQEASGSDTYLRLAVVTAVATTTTGSGFFGIMADRPVNTI